MNKTIFSMIAIGLLLLSCFIVMPASSKDTINTASGTTLYVDDDNTGGPWDGTEEHPYQYIQDGIKAADDGDTVFVLKGDYAPISIIDKSINLLGENKDSTTINGIYLSSNQVNISGFKIFNCDSEGIYLYGSNFNNIFDNIICDNAYYGLFFQDSNNNLISHNIIKSNLLTGICFYQECNFNIVQYNHISNNGIGIGLTASNNNNIFKNNFEENNYGITISYEAYGANNLISCNNFIKNSKKNAECTDFYSFLLNSFKNNYWDRPRILPYLITHPLFRIPCNFDLHPALKPNEINVFGGVD